MSWTTWLWLGPIIAFAVLLAGYSAVMVGIAALALLAGLWEGIRTMGRWFGAPVSDELSALSRLVDRL